MYPQSKRESVNKITEGVIGRRLRFIEHGFGVVGVGVSECLCQELALRGIPFEREVPLPLEYKGIRCKCGYRSRHSRRWRGRRRSEID